MIKPRPAPEKALQAAAADYLLLVERSTRQITFSHPPNEGKRSRRTGHELKAAGMRPGEPDLAIHFNGGRTAFVELKSANGRTSPEQSHRIEQLRCLGFRVELWKCRDTGELLRRLAALLTDHGVAPLPRVF